LRRKLATKGKALSKQAYLGHMNQISAYRYNVKHSAAGGIWIKPSQTGKVQKLSLQTAQNI